MRQSVRPMADVMSGILNLVSPDCGGRMGGPGKHSGASADGLATGMGEPFFIEHRWQSEKNDETKKGTAILFAVGSTLDLRDPVDHSRLVSDRMVRNKLEQTCGW